MNIINYLIILIPVLINVAFITLLERKILGLSQLRKGPHKVSIVGVLQPFRDAIKLFSKEVLAPYISNIKQFIFSPVLSLFIVLMAYMIFPLLEATFALRLRVIFVYMLIRINIYPLIIRG
jgi:NADH:ubiquinone oxidoreductase subunit H